MTRSPLLTAAGCLLVASLISACGRLPAVRPVAPDAGGALLHRCEDVFPRGKWQFVHAIEAALSGGSSVVLGVSKIDSAGRRIHSLIMTVEGMVLFEADSGEGLHVRRAVPPFDSKDFARGLMGDIGFIFFAPRGAAAAGKLPDGAPVCRYRRDDGGVTDVLPSPSGGWELRQYDAKGRLTRRLRASDVETVHGQRIARRLTLEARPAAGTPYRLNMKRIEALPR